MRFTSCCRELSAAALLRNQPIRTSHKPLPRPVPKNGTQVPNAMAMPVTISSQPNA
jgi:hypothetical protein